MDYVIEFLKKLRGLAAMLVVWWIGWLYYSGKILGAVGTLEQTWTDTWHYMVFLFVLVVLCLIVRTRIVLGLIAIYGFSLAAQQVSVVLDMNTGYLEWVTEKIAPMFVGVQYIADQIGFGLGELAECGLGAFYGLFIGVVACAAWCFVNPGDGSTYRQRVAYKQRSRGGSADAGIDDPLKSHRDRKKTSTSSSRSTSTTRGKHEAPK